MAKRLLRGTLIATALVAAVAGYSAWVLLRPLEISTTCSVQVIRGSSVSQAIAAVNSTCPLPNPTLTQWAAKVVARISHRTVQSGWYVFESGDTQYDVLKSLFSGHKRPTVRVTIPEGLTFKEIGGLIGRVLESDSAEFVRWCIRDSICRAYGVVGSTMEGYLMPDTYAFFWKEDASVVGTVLADHARDVWQDHCEGRLADAGLTRHEALTLASIVQAEAAQSEEMPRIAGVYANRLAKGMKLEADPTVQYALGQKQRVLLRHLQVQSPYNTYDVFGLPPGPLGNPGLAAMQAALQPEQHSYVFFVAKGDGSGLHNFARTGIEHSKNVALYRNRRK